MLKTVLNKKKMKNDASEDWISEKKRIKLKSLLIKKYVRTMNNKMRKKKQMKGLMPRPNILEAQRD